jgi:hypothetical protein
MGGSVWPLVVLAPLALVSVAWSAWGIRRDGRGRA